MKHTEIIERTDFEAWQKIQRKGELRIGSYSQFRRRRQRARQATAQMSDNDFRLCVYKQDAIAVEEIPNSELSAYVVVKASPFTIELGVMQGNVINVPFDLRQLVLEGTLVYDREGYKQVDYVKSKPVETKIKFNDEGDRAMVECRIYALTSQHENVLFRVRFDASKGGQSVCPAAISHPIRVISKTDQLRSKSGAIESAGQKSRVTAPTILAKAREIEEQDKKNTLLLEQLASQRERRESTLQAGSVPSAQAGGLRDSVSDLFSLSYGNTHASMSHLPIDNTPQDPSRNNDSLTTLATSAFYTNEDNFMDSFDRLLKCWATLENESKIEHIQLVRNKFGEKDRQRLSSFLETLKAYTTEKSCQCHPCPYEQQVRELAEGQELLFPDTSFDPNFPPLL